jgi:acetylcholinesterase
MLFQAQRRFWSQTTSAPSYAYIFTGPQSGGDPALGVYHASELPYLFSDLAKSGPPNTAQLSRVMLDYWISFAVSLTPNDGKGTTRMLSAASSPALSLIFSFQDLSGGRTMKLR